MSFLSKLFGKKKSTAPVQPLFNSAPKPEPVLYEEEEEEEEVAYIDLMDFSHDTGDAYFASLITEDAFPGYTIERDVHPGIFDENAHPACFPITYLFSKGGTPVLAVFIMKEGQRSTMPARGTYRILEDNGIGYIRFTKGLPNEKNYVLPRIRKNL